MSRRRRTKKKRKGSQKRKILSYIAIAATVILIPLTVLAMSGVFRQYGGEDYTQRPSSQTESPTTGAAPEESAGSTPAASPEGSGAPESAAPETVQPEQTPDTSAAPEVTDGPEVTDAPATQTPTQSDDNWMNEKIEEYKDEIEPEDLDDFNRIVSQLAQDTIRQLLEDGLNEEEQELIKEHLRQRLSSEDYERVKQLFAKYIFILDEEL